MSIPKVGLTGGIGSGKSTVGQTLKLFGAALYDSDIHAKTLMSNDTILREQIVSLFGPEAYCQHSESQWQLDRALIAQRVFADPTLLGKLNSIVHPAVARDFDQWAATIEKENIAPYIIKEAAILIESGAWRAVDRIVVVTAPKELRAQRVIARDGVSLDQVEKRMSAQMSDTERLEYAHYTIISDDRTLLIPQLEELHKQLRSIVL